MNKQDEHDCTVGHLNDWVYLSTIKDVLESEAKGWNEHNKTMNSLTRGDIKFLEEEYKPLDFLDRRKNFMRMFNNCPYCGLAFNWKEIKKMVVFYTNINQ